MMQPLHVVIVDDEPMIRRGLSRLVQQHEGPWKVLGLFANGKEALAYMKESQVPVHLLITDVKMPEMDGLRLIQEARHYHRFLPLVISGYDDFDYVRSALKEGAFDYVLKPIDRQQFSKQLGEISSKIRRQYYVEETRMLRELIAVYNFEAVNMDWLVHFPTGVYRLCCVSLDEPPVKMRGFSNREWELMMYALGNIIEEILGNAKKADEVNGWSWQGEPRQFWILVGGMEHIDPLAERVRAAVNQHLALTVTIAASKEFDDLHMLPNYRNDVLSLLYLRLVYGGNRVYFGDRILQSSEYAMSAKLHTIGNRVRAAIGHESEEETRRLLSECFQEIEALQHPEAIEKAVQFVILQIMNAWLETDFQKGKHLIFSDLLQIHEYISSYQRLRHKMIELVLEVSNVVRKKRLDLAWSPVDKAKQWIVEHLSESLTIPVIAEKIPMNPTYFCEIFKLQTGETVLDFITRLRMEKAARYLIETDNTLIDIVERVGYKDPKYFSRQFKQRFHVLPSKYRKIAQLPSE